MVNIIICSLVSSFSVLGRFSIIKHGGWPSKALVIQACLDPILSKVNLLLCVSALSLYIFHTLLDVLSSNVPACNFFLFSKLSFNYPYIPLYSDTSMCVCICVCVYRRLIESYNARGVTGLRDPVDYPSVVRK